MKKRALGNVAVAAITAGILKGTLFAEDGLLFSANGLLTQSTTYQQLPVLAKNFTCEMIKAAVNLHVDYAINGGSYTAKLQDNVVHGLVATVSGYLCENVGDWHQENQLNALSNKLVDGVLHKLMHGAIGGLSSYALGEDVKAGAIGAMVAESVAEFFDHTYHGERQSLQDQQKALDEQVQRGEISPHHAEIQRDDLDKKIKAIKDSCMNLGKYAAIAAATIARVDPNVALRTATTALENNFELHDLTREIQLMGILFAKEEIFEAFIKGGDVGGLRAMAKAGAIKITQNESGQDVYWIEGKSYKSAHKAWLSASKKYPTFYTGLKDYLNTRIPGVAERKSEALNDLGEAVERLNQSKGGYDRTRAAFLLSLQSQHVEEALSLPETVGDAILEFGPMAGGAIKAGVKVGQAVRTGGRILRTGKEAAKVGQTAAKLPPVARGQNAPLKAKPQETQKPSKTVSSSPRAVNQNRPGSMGGQVKDAAYEVKEINKRLLLKEKEQPWVIRPGQEYKEKIVGRAQKTGTPGHEVRVYREAIRLAKEEDMDMVFLNRGYNRIIEPKIKSNRRPDVMAVRKDGKVDAIEVPSRTDNKEILIQRNEEALSNFPKKHQGKVKIKEITTEKK